MTKSLPKEILEELKTSMQKEIHMMRELLANMLKEELSLQLQDKSSWEQVMIERAEMVNRLSFLREKRQNISLHFNNQTPDQDSDAIEILTLRDQILALAERMNQIKCRNEYLAEHVVLQTHSTNQREMESNIQRVKRKSSIATYPPKR